VTITCPCQYGPVCVLCFHAQRSSVHVCCAELDSSGFAVPGDQLVARMCVSACACVREEREAIALRTHDNQQAQRKQEGVTAKENGSTINPTPYTLHPNPTLYTLRPPPYALRPTPYALHPTTYTLKPKRLGYARHFRRKTSAWKQRRRSVRRALRSRPWNESASPSRRSPRAGTR
jgi:hypothetical protein